MQQLKYLLKLLPSPGDVGVSDCCSGPQAFLQRASLWADGRLARKSSFLFFLHVFSPSGNSAPASTPNFHRASREPMGIRGLKPSGSTSCGKTSLITPKASSVPPQVSRLPGGHMFDLSLSLRSDKCLCCGKLDVYLSRGMTASQRTGIVCCPFSKPPARSGSRPGPRGSCSRLDGGRAASEPSVSAAEGSIRAERPGTPSSY